jgi:hypothetical protein
VEGRGEGEEGVIEGDRYIRFVVRSQSQRSLVWHP